ncbi:SCO3242 family prenyltransferase [Streptomyces sp. NPDC059564]|uniref:SCO3242 family prenyltransferase n=1 Tax=Streptomyces sp. NPDC059564 TaxID=3346865 RepID=UPI00369D6B82
MNPAPDPGPALDLGPALDAGPAADAVGPGRSARPVAAEPADARPLRLPPFPGRVFRVRRTLRAYAELVRAPAAITVPGDVLAGALATGRGTGPRTLGLAASSVCLYWAGMALNDWADRELDAVERPERPLPSGRIRPGAALATAAGLTAAGLAVAALAGGPRTALRRTLPLAGAVWAYDLGAKSTPFGPAVMAAARALDVLHGTGPAPARPALLPAAAVAAHTLGLTRLSRHEVDGAPPREAALTLAAATVAAAATAGRRTGPAQTAALALYATSYAPALTRVLRTPDAPRVRRAVGAGIHALLPLQAALAARAGAPGAAAALAAALPLVRRLSRKVSST